VPDNGEDQDWMFQNHPDLIDDGWAKKAAKVARRQARRAPAPVGTRTRRSPRLRSTITVIVVVGALLVLVKHPWTTTPTPTTQASPIVPTATPTVRQDTPLNLNEPFGNTPAAGWSDGAAGIVPPAATAVGRYSAAQVTTALNLVKQVLVASHLDPRMLVDHDTSTYLSLLAPDARTDEQKTLADPRYTPDRGGGLTLLATGFQLLPAPVKVNGSMSFSIDSNGELLVHTNYVFAFPFAPTDPKQITQPWQIVALQHVAEDYEYVADKRMTAGSQGLFVHSTQAYYDSMACSQSTKGFLAPAIANPATNGGPDSENPDSYYDPNHSLSVPNSC
jgi:hypothetical protein